MSEHVKHCCWSANSYDLDKQPVDPENKERVERRKERRKEGRKKEPDCLHRQPPEARCLKSERNKERALSIWNKNRDIWNRNIEKPFGFYQSIWRWRKPNSSPDKYLES